MYTLVPSKTFRKMLKRLRGSGKFCEDILITLLDLLLEGKPLSLEYLDHQLKGDLVGFRECHVSGNLLLVYRRDDKKKEIVLVRIGTHHEIFGN